MKLIMDWRKNVFLKKSRRYYFDAYRHGYYFLRPVVNANNLSPIIVNSIPKSGTHLLVQIITSIPDLVDSGNFLASTPSFTMREINESKMSSRVKNLLSKEVCAAHLFYSDSVAQSIASRNAIHFFIYRDPRDICVSEALYLSEMNRWHRLHREYSKLHSLEERIDLSIHGLRNSGSVYYPNIKTRVDRYLQWLSPGDVFCVKYEDLISNNVEAVIRSILSHYCVSSNNDIDVTKAVELALERIKPQYSHTFRKGKRDQWKEVLSRSQQQEINSLLCDAMSIMGYKT